MEKKKVFWYAFSTCSSDDGDTLYSCYIGGYSVFIPFSVYTRQLGRYPYMYVFYPNFWALFREAPYYIFSSVAILSILAGLGVFAISVIRKKTEVSEKQWIEFAVWTTFFMMCFLPCMHERYGMLVEILAIIYAFLNRKTWWNAVVIGTGSYIAYLQVTFGWHILPDQWIAVAYLLSFGFFTWQMIRGWNSKQIKEDYPKDQGPVLKKGVFAIENAMMDLVNKYILVMAFVLLTILAVIIRKPMIECTSADFLQNLIEVEGNYHTPLYMLLMWILISINRVLLPEKTLFFLVKLLCLAADMFAAAMAAVWVYDWGIRKDDDLKKEKKDESGDWKFLAVMVYGAMLFLPMVLLNSPFWAHLDSISIGLLIGAYLLYVRKKDIPAGILTGLACGLLAHYALVLALIMMIMSFYRFMAGKKEKAAVEQKRQSRIGNICVITMLFGSMGGLLSSYSVLQCIYKLLNFWRSPGTWMVYPLLVLALLLCFYDKKWIPVWVLLEVAVILDWGEFLYEMPVLPHAVYELLYLAAGFWAIKNICEDYVPADERKNLSNKI